MCDLPESSRKRDDTYKIENTLLSHQYQQHFYGPMDQTHLLILKVTVVRILNFATWWRYFSGQSINNFDH